MTGIVNHLVRRGFEVTQQHIQNGGQNEVVTLQLPKWGIATLMATGLLYLLVAFAVSQ